MSIPEVRYKQKVELHGIEAQEAQDVRKLTGPSIPLFVLTRVDTSKGRVSNHANRRIVQRMLRVKTRSVVALVKPTQDIYNTTQMLHRFVWGATGSEGICHEPAEHASIIVNDEVETPGTHLTKKTINLRR